VKRVLKPHTHFSHAFEDWTGEKWEWNIDGKHNNPMDSSDSEIIAFYIGFNYAKKGQNDALKIKRQLNLVENEMKLLKKFIDKFKRYGEL